MPEVTYKIGIQMYGVQWEYYYVPESRLTEWLNQHWLSEKVTKLTIRREKQ